MANMKGRNRPEIHWHNSLTSGEELLTEATLQEKAMLVGRVGLELLACGTGAWRIRNSMMRVARGLNIECSVNIGLMSISFNCFDSSECVTQTMNLSNTGVNTFKLYRLERFVKRFSRECENMTVAQVHAKLDEYNKLSPLYSPLKLGLASGLACCAFTFLLGGGLWEMLLVFLGAAIGNFIRALLIRRHYNLFMTVAISVSAACLSYAAFLRLFNLIFGLSMVHQAGYICAMLFIIPGFPFITSGIDFAKLDMRSGIERLCYAVNIVIVATLCGWVMALILGLHPADFLPQNLNWWSLLLLRLVASFFGVFGFSIMFNSPIKLASIAASIGALSNTLRLELVDFASFPPAVAAFCGALLSGLLASLLKKKLGYPRISITVPSIVIMVPGLYLYKGIYYLGTMSLSQSASWISAALLITLALPFGLVTARFLTDRTFRHGA